MRTTRRGRPARDPNGHVVLPNEQQAKRVMKRRRLRRPCQRVPQDTLAHVVMSVTT